MTRTLVASSIVVAVMLSGITAHSAHAGGTDWHFDAVSYAPGERASAWAPIDRSLVIERGYARHGVRYHAFAVPWDDDVGATPSPHGVLPPNAVKLSRVRLVRGAPPGPLLTGPDHFALRFTVPELPAGRYAVLECNVPCTRPLPFVTGGWFDVVDPSG